MPILFPNFFINSYPNTSLDVIEIDPVLTSISEKYFNLDANKMNIYHEDGRVFLQRNSKKYEVIYLDAYSTHSPPFHLSTIEMAELIGQHLDDKGIVFVNIMSSIEGEKGKMLRAQFHTFKQIFPYVYIIPSTERDTLTPQNIVLIGMIKAPKSLVSLDPSYQKYLSKIWTNKIPNDTQILTDDFAPVEFLSKFML